VWSVKHSQKKNLAIFDRHARAWCLLNEFGGDFALSQDVGIENQLSMTFQCQCRGFEVHVLVEKNLKKHQEPAKNIQEPLFRWVDLQWEGHLSKGWLNSHDLKTRSICSKCGNCPANQVWSQEDNAK